jgi:hypothetical protein
MNAGETIQSGLLASADGKRAMATIVELARKRQQDNCSRDRQDPLVSWESVSEFGKFKITVRCEYEVMNP